MIVLVYSNVTALTSRGLAQRRHDIITERVSVARSIGPLDGRDLLPKARQPQQDCEETLVPSIDLLCQFTALCVWDSVRGRYAQLGQSGRDKMNAVFSPGPCSRAAPYAFHTI